MTISEFTPLINIALVAMMVLILFIVFVNIISTLMDRLYKNLAYRRESKWDMNLFSLPEEQEEFKKYGLTRSIERKDGFFLFTISSGDVSSTRIYKYRNVKEALKRYRSDFKREEVQYVKRNLSNLKVRHTHSQLIKEIQEKLAVLETKADGIETSITHIQTNLGNNND